jgi:hypothetical protein
MLQGLISATQGIPAPPSQPTAFPTFDLLDLASAPPAVGNSSSNPNAGVANTSSNLTSNLTDNWATFD